MDHDGRKMFAKIGSAPTKRVYREALGVIEDDGKRIAVLESRLKRLSDLARAYREAHKKAAALSRDRWEAAVEGGEIAPAEVSELLEANNAWDAIAMDESAWGEKTIT